MKLPHQFAWILVAAIAALSAAASAFAQPSFVAFESGHVRPLALSPDGSQLFAVNTPDNTLEIFDVSSAGLVAAGTVPVTIKFRMGIDEDLLTKFDECSSSGIADIDNFLSYVTATVCGCIRYV